MVLLTCVVSVYLLLFFKVIAMDNVEVKYERLP